MIFEPINPSAANPTRSEVRLSGGVPTLHVNNRPAPGMAYITYFDDRADYASFAAAGVRLFSVNAYFGSVGINNDTRIHPFAPGIFDKKGSPDFSFFDGEMKKLLDICPEAMVFPRVDMAMPLWWLEEIPDELLCGEYVRPRECFASQKWLADVKELLYQFVRHLETADYAPHIIGYQLSDGQTQEWMPFIRESVSGKAETGGFARWMAENRPGTEVAGLPDPETSDAGIVKDYYEYVGDTVADAICTLSSFVKEITGRRAAVGCFYGYTTEITFPSGGHTALSKVLRCPDVDFICSPVSYAEGRARGTDMPPMPPIDSVRLHGKLYFTEADIRTYLSDFPGVTRPGSVEEGTYLSPIWKGDPDPDVSRAQVRLAFLRVITTSEALWWFDMWGGWYRDEGIMRDMKRFSEIYRVSMNDHKRESRAEAAVIIDEKVWLTPGISDSAAANTVRAKFALARAGAPYDIYEASDFGEIRSRYKFFVFLAPAMTDAVSAAAAYCAERAVGHMVYDGASPLSCDYVREAYRAAGLHIWCSSGDIVWADRYYAGIYSVTPGKKEIDLGKKRMVRTVLGGPECAIHSPIETAKISVDMPADRCWMFRTE